MRVDRSDVAAGGDGSADVAVAGGGGVRRVVGSGGDAGDVAAGGSDVFVDVGPGGDAGDVGAGGDLAADLPLIGGDLADGTATGGDIAGDIDVGDDRVDGSSGGEWCRDAAACRSNRAEPASGSRAASEIAGPHCSGGDVTNAVTGGDRRVDVGRRLNGVDEAAAGRQRRGHIEIASGCILANRSDRVDVRSGEDRVVGDFLSNDATDRAAGRDDVTGDCQSRLDKPKTAPRFHQIADAATGGDAPNVATRCDVTGNGVGSVGPRHDSPNVAPGSHFAVDAIERLHGVDCAAGRDDILRDRVSRIDAVDIAAGGDLAANAPGR